MAGKTLADDFGRLLIDTVQISALESEGVWGTVYGTATDYYCFGRDKNAEIKNEDTGEIVKTTFKIFISGEVMVNNSDKVVFGGETLPVSAVKRIPNDQGGIYATVIYTNKNLS